MERTYSIILPPSI